MNILVCTLLVISITVYSVCGSVNEASVKRVEQTAPSSISAKSSADYIDPNRLTTLEEKIIMCAVTANLTLNSWDDPKDIHPDHLFEYYEALVIFGEVELIDGAEYIPQDIAEEVIRRYFDVDSSYLRTSSYYSLEQKGYFVGGLGNVLDIIIEDTSIIKDITTITYALYYNDAFQKRAKMKVRVIDKSNYSFISNEEN